jgi:hypothetical protein
MSLLDVVRAGVKVANTVTTPLQATVSYQRDLGNDEFGTRTLGSVVKLKAIVDWKQRQVRTITGLLSVSRASVLFLDVAALSAATAGQGIDENDVITLPDGTTGPILDMSGFIDAGTGQPVATEVFLG